MDEVRGRIVADAAPTQIQRRLVQVGQFHTRRADVDGHALHVQAVMRHAAAVPGQAGIGPGRPIAGYHLEGLPGLEPGGQLVQQVEEFRSDRVHLSGAEIPQEAIHRMERGVQIAPVLEIGKGEMLPRVQVVQIDVPLRRSDEGLGPAGVRRRQKGRGQRTCAEG